MRAELKRRDDAEVPAAAAQRPEELGIRVLTGGDDLARVQATRDQARALVDEAVVDAPCVVVSRIVRGEDLAGEHGSESFGGWGVEVEHAATLPPHRRPRKSWKSLRFGLKLRCDG